MRILAAAILLATVPAAVAGGSDVPDLCRGETFQRAFADGLDSMDYLSVSKELLALGDAAVPCLDLVAHQGGTVLGISRCENNQAICRSWAVRALASLKSEAADRSLIHMLREGLSGPQLYGLLTAMASRHPAAARPSLLKLLRAPDPGVRSRALLALGAIGRKNDFDEMARCARGLPSAELSKAARAFEFLADVRAVPLLHELASRLAESSRGDIKGSISRLEVGRPLRPE